MSATHVDCIKVLISFITTAFLTLTIVIIYYAVGFVPDEHMNSIDAGIVATVWRRAGSRPSKKWEVTLRNAVLMYSDQQLVTGIAILASGYAQVRCGLSVYHWKTIVYLAWFSSLTHLTTLTFLRQYFQSNPVARLWRACLMLLVIVMLIVALLPTSQSFFLLHGSGYPVACYFQRLVRDFKPDVVNTTVVTISILVLAMSYLTRLIKLSRRATQKTRLWVRTRPGNVIKRGYNKSIRRAEEHHILYWQMVSFVLETLYVLLRACFDIYESTLWEVSDSYCTSSVAIPLAESVNSADAVVKLCARVGN